MLTLKKPGIRQGIAASVLSVFLMVSFLALSAHPGLSAQGMLTVGSKIDTEGSLLGQMIVILLRSKGFKVIDRTGLGATSVVRQAIIAGEIDIYPEYTGNGYYFFEDSDAGVWKDPESAHRRVSALDLEKNGIVWLSPAPANNTWAIAVRKDLAQQESLSTLEDLAAFVNSGGRIRLACSEEFATRPDALPAFEDAYGFKLDSGSLLILSGGNTAQTEQAASLGRDGVNAAMAYGTDGGIAVLDLLVLEDTLGVQPVYEPSPIIRKEILDAYPEIAGIMDPVFERLDLLTLQTLNGRIAVEGQDPARVAGEFLRSQGFVD
ncbi:MAG: ABC transporter substrate-binding protein [Thermovirgaceae bacterium]|jgi:osmoprotectant transport system substrate-binding protein|nr:ABC transporter substrate-binding protein [Synergistales bacterium]MDI9393391.1 ABC transporter substrate-binding protein [Synergistota bacterium]MDY0178409.1 ABC transporter substrate-binding protein [Synergistaceae bacterium]HRW87629.1 ABC transporter substrate-binding protein [Thermovirgaceae bacterium]MDD3133455.1 ABC transporter substrate-binding protein [Synergistales bacterium]